MKVCSKCNRELDINMFKKSKQNSDGLKGWCNDCSKEYTKQYNESHKKIISDKCKKYYEEHKEIILEKARVYSIGNREHAKQYRLDNKEYISKYVKQRRNNNKELFAKRTKEWHDVHKEVTAENSKLYRKENRNILITYMKKYQTEHLEEYRINTQKREAMKRLLPHTLTVEQWYNTKLSFNNRCCYCGRELPLVQEHFIALIHNGEYTKENILPSCNHCNCSKHDYDFFTWYPKYKYYSKKREAIILKYLHYKNNIQQLSIL